MFIVDGDSKSELLAQIVLGGSNVSKIKINMPARIGKIVEPVIELTKFGWMIMSPARKRSLEHVLDSVNHI